MHIPRLSRRLSLALLTTALLLPATVLLAQQQGWTDCRVATIQKPYSDGDWRVTIRCEQQPGDPFTVGQKITVTPVTTTPPAPGVFSITAAPAAIEGSPDASVTVTWANIPNPTPGDWLGLHLSTAPSQLTYSMTDPRWMYVDCVRHEGHGVTAVPSGSCTFALSSFATGTYNVRLFSNEGGTEIGRTNNFALNAPTCQTPVDCVWSGWGPWVLQSETACVGGTKTVTEVHTRTITTQASCGGQACEGSTTETRTSAQSCVITPPSGVLSPSDFTFLGSFAIPGAVFEAPHTTAALAGRSDTTPLTFYMTKGNGELLSFRDPGTYSFNAATAPPAGSPIVLGWPNWNGNTLKAVSWDYNTGSLRSYQTTGNPWPYLGLAYYNGYIYLSYLDYYNSAYGGTDHCLVATNLAASQSSWASGPYRFSGTSVKHLCGNLINTPKGLGLLGSMMAISRNTDNVWGPSLWVTPYPTASTPGGYQSPPLAPTALIDFNINDRAPRAGDYKPNLLDPYNPDGPQPAPGPWTGTWTQRDRMNTAAWIETTTGKQGLVFMGGMGTDQIWYGSWDAGPNGEINECRSADRGENADTFRPEWRIYDTTALTGTQTKPVPVHVFNPWSRPNGTFAAFACESFSMGAYFDKASSKLFVSAGYGLIQVWSITP